MASNTNNPSYLPAYLIVGEDHLKRDTALARLRSRLGELGDIAFNSDVFEGSVCSANDVVNACNTIPFACPYRLVELRSVDKLSKDGQEALVEYLSASSDSTILVMTSDKLAKNTRLYKAIVKLGAHSVIECLPVKPKEVPRLVREMAVSNGVTITPSAAELLVSKVGNNTVHLNEELKKIALNHSGNDPITDHEIAAMVSQVSELKPWDLQDALAQRNLPKVLSVLQKMPSATPYELLPRCVARIRQLMCVNALVARGETSQLAEALGLAKNVAWKVKDYRVWARNYTCEELRCGLVSARDAEEKMKSGTDPDTAFKDWLVGFVSK